MSVLVEACCLMVKQLSVEIGFPGGLEAFVRRARAMQAVRSVLFDGEVIAISVYDPFQLEPLLLQMVHAGLVPTDEDGHGDFVFVDMETGPLVPCAWVSVEAHRHGFGVAKLSGGHPSPFISPQGWYPQYAWQLLRYDLRDAGPERVLPLGNSEDGEEVVLDFDSGRVISGSADRSPIITIADPDTVTAPIINEPRLVAAQRVLAEKRVPYRVDTVNTELHVLFALDDIDTDEGVQASLAAEYPRANAALDLEMPPAALALEQSPTPSRDGMPDVTHEDDDAPVECSPLPHDVSCLLRIAMSPSLDSESLDYRVVLPRRLNIKFRDCEPVLHDIRRRTDQIIAGVFDSDESTGTMQIILTVVRHDGESWEQTVERGFTVASGAGTQMTRITANWCVP